MAACVAVGLCQSATNFAISTAWPIERGTTMYPSRSPGSIVFENDPTKITRPVRSRILTGSIGRSPNRNSLS